MAVVQQTVRGLLVLLMTLARTARSQEECPRNHDCKCEVMDQRRLRALEVDCSEQDLKRLPNMAVSDPSRADRQGASYASEMFCERRN